jgi:hypothetical protein
LELPHAVAARAVRQTVKARSAVKILKVMFFILKQYPFGPLHVNPSGATGEVDIIF